MVRKIFLLLITWIVRITCDLDVEGSEKVPLEGGCIIVSNHLGRLDAILVYHLLKRDDIILTIAEKYRKFALFRLAAQSLDGVWINRENPDLQGLRKVIRRLGHGGVLVIAPEGTRSRTGALQSAKHGAGYIAAVSQLPVYPVGVIGTEDRNVIEHLRRFRKAKVLIKVGHPFMLPEIPRENRHNTLKKHTEEIMCQIASLLPPRYHGICANNPRILEIRNN